MKSVSYAALHDTGRCSKGKSEEKTRHSQIRLNKAENRMHATEERTRDKRKKNAEVSWTQAVDERTSEIKEKCGGEYTAGINKKKEKNTLKKRKK